MRSWLLHWPGMPGAIGVVAISCGVALFHCEAVAQTIPAELSSFARQLDTQFVIEKYTAHYESSPQDADLIETGINQLSGSIARAATNGSPRIKPVRTRENASSPIVAIPPEPRLKPSMQADVQTTSTEPQSALLEQEPVSQMLLAQRRPPRHYRKTSTQKLRGQAFIDRENELRTASGEPVKGNEIERAKFYLDHAMAAEALELLNDFSSTDEELLLIQTAARLQLRRFEDILNDKRLSIKLGDSVVLGVAAANLGAYDLALSRFNDVSGFQPSSEVEFLALLETVIKAGEAERVESLIQAVPQQWRAANGTSGLLALSEIAVMKANQSTDKSAIDDLQKRVALLAEPWRTRAMIALLSLDPTQTNANDRLAKLGLNWRGGTTEREYRFAKGEFAQRSGDVAGAFSAYRSVKALFVESDLARASDHAMQNLLSSLLAGATGMTVLDATQLFYENIDLLAPGRDGDEQIRNIVDRLVKLDLLADAAELLEHQVFNRLRGHERSAIATELAAIYLADRQPDQALRVIQSTRITGLTQELIDQRRLLEATALWRSGQHDKALARLEGQDTTSFSEQSLRADILLDMGDVDAAEPLLFASAMRLINLPQIDTQSEFMILKAVATAMQTDAQEHLALIKSLANERLVGRPVLAVIELTGEGHDLAQFFAAYQNWVLSNSRGDSEI